MAITGVENIIAWVAESTADQVSVHHGHRPDLRFTSDTSASGVWAMEDRLFRTAAHSLVDGSNYVHGSGHDRETYTADAGTWRIASTRLTRLRVQLCDIL